MESLVSEPGPKNPLIFLSLSLINRIPGYNPDEKETMNQLECMNDLLSNVTVSVFRLESTKNAVAVAIDALLTVSKAEMKKSTVVRISALNCLNLFVEKLSLCGINSLIDIIPGILSRMIKMVTGRVDVEIEGVISLSLGIIKKLVECFWKEQGDWISEEESEEKFIILKQKFKENIDMAFCALRPLIKSQRSKEFHSDLFEIAKVHLKGSSPNLSDSFLKLYLLLVKDSETAIAPPIDPKRFVQFYVTEIVEWFDVNYLTNIHEDIIIERLNLILGLINLKNFESFLLISDLFLIIKKLTEVNLVSIGDESVSIEYSDSSSYGIENAFKEEEEKEGNVKDSGTTDNYIAVDNNSNLIVPLVNFKRTLKFSKSFYRETFHLFDKLVQIDHVTIENLLIQFEDETIEKIIQKIDLSSHFYQQKNNYFSLDLIKNLLKYYERITSISRFEHVQLIHLVTLKLLWSCRNHHNCTESNGIIRYNLLIILSGMASDWIILKEFSTQILEGISKTYNMSVKDFIKQNDQFILDRLGIQLALPSLFPSAPKIIACLVRDIVDPLTALKFTDLLVKRVSTNLAVYQKHSSYCKDLIFVATETVESIRRTESIEFIDPKDFAFINKELVGDSDTSGSLEDESVVPSDISDNSDQSTPKSHETTHKPLNCQQRIICLLLKIGINFILSDFKSIRSNSIDLIRICVDNFTFYQSDLFKESSELCQLIHLAWPNIILVLKESSLNNTRTNQDVSVIESVSNCCNSLFSKLPLFMRDRFVKDYWRLFLCLRSASFNSAYKTSFESNTSYTNASSYAAISSHNIPFYSTSSIKINNLLLDILDFGLINCKPSTEICLEIIEFLIKIGSNRYEIYENIWKIEPDIIWYYYSVELAAGEAFYHISSTSPELKSFRIPQRSRDQFIKDILKQFM